MSCRLMAPYSPVLYYFKTGKAVVTAEEEIPWTLDGEFGGRVTDVTIQNHSRAIEMIVPR